MNISGSMPVMPQRPANADQDYNPRVNDFDQDDVKKAPVQNKIAMEKSVQPNLGQMVNSQG